MKFLTLVNRDSVHLAPKQKVLPADVFSKLLEAQTLLSRAKMEAIDYRKSVTKECEELKEQAELRGFEVGLTQWNAQIKLLEEEILKVKEEMEKSIVSLAITAAKKIVGKEIKLDRETIVDIVSTALKPVSQHKKVAIFVNRKDLDILEENRPRLKALFEHLKSLTLSTRDDIAPGGCVIETEAGIINAQLEYQWDALETAFQTLLKKQAKES
ncbi:MAG: HrpE/YscL family type III secretion apparatus protein [Chlamydiia bacterium]|nr:HrpE/YscL family type III secretion apparatus protein [Chlamydiia bacterium]